MEFRYLVVDENSIIAKFKYLDDAVSFIYSIIPDIDSELFGYSISDTNMGDWYSFEDIKKIIKNMSLDEYHAV